MSTIRHDSDGVRAADGPAGRIAPALEALALALVLLIVALRPWISESYDASLHSIARVLDTRGDILPDTTAWLDLGIWLAACAAAGAAALRRRPWRWSGLEVGWLLLLLAAVISTIATSNRRIAINAACDGLSVLVLAMLVVNLCRDRFRITLMLAVLAASGVSSAARCVMQVGIEYEETRQQYERMKQVFWQRQGVPLDSPQVKLFERRMDAREATGFFPHSNAQGALLAMSAFAAGGLGGVVRRLRLARMLLLVLALMLFAAILTTASRGAVVSAFAGLLLWLAITAAGPGWAARWRLLLAAFWGAVLAAVLAVVGYGLRTGGLPGDSLRFRWNYWQVTHEIIAQNLWSGTGLLNFDRAYLLYKPVEFPEEIKDPHNFVLSITAQCGILGLAGLLACSAGASWLILRRASAESAVSDGLSESSPAHGTTVAWVAGLIAAFVVLRLWTLRAFMGQPEGAAYVLFDLGLYGLLWCVAFAGLIWLARSGDHADIPSYRPACIAGVTAFILQNTIDHSMMYPGTMTPFAALLGLALTRWPPGGSDPAPSPPARLAPATVALAGTLAACALVVVPVTRASYWMTRARQEAGSAAIEYYRQAAAADPLDPAPLAELAEVHVQVHAQTGRPESLDAALLALGEAVRRDPEQIGYYRTRARLHERRYDSSGSMADLYAALGAARRVVAMYPNSPDDHLALGALLVRTAIRPDAEDLLPEAIAAYEQALWLDAARAPGEIRRWPPDMREEIRQQLEALRRQAGPASDPG